MIEAVSDRLYEGREFRRSNVYIPSTADGNPCDSPRRRALARSVQFNRR